MRVPVLSPGSILDLWEMLKVLDSRCLPALTNLGRMADKLHDLRREMQEPGGLFEARHYALLAQSVQVLERAAMDMQLVAALAEAQRCRDVLGSLHWDARGWWMSPNDVNALAMACGHLPTVFADELQARALFSLPSASVNMIDSKEPFGPEVDAAFPLAAEDIGEATKCLAFGRYTAVVFHLMRAMESAVQAAASKLGTKQIDKVWGHLLADIKTAVEAMPQGSDRNQWSENLTLLYHVKQAWRNDTMHPKNTYTEEQATEVFRAVKSFMTHLAGLVT